MAAQIRALAANIRALVYIYSHLLGGVYVPCIYRMPDGVIIGNSGSLLRSRSMCDVDSSSAIASHCLLILQKRSGPHSVSDYNKSVQCQTLCSPVI